MKSNIKFVKSLETVKIAYFGVVRFAKTYILTIFEAKYLCFWHQFQYCF